MAADYAGAVAAIRQYFVERWVDGSSQPLTPIGFVNEVDPVTVDPLTGAPRGTPLETVWVLFEVVSQGSFQSGAGKPGSNVIVYDGLIKIYVFVRSGEGVTDAFAKAVAAGEIFRNRLFYDTVTTGCYVRSGYDLQGQPRIDEGVASSEDGNWFNVTATIPFEYWHRG